MMHFSCEGEVFEDEEVVEDVLGDEELSSGHG